MRIWMIWVLAVLITAGAAVYQKMTGPTYPKNVSVDINGSDQSFKLLRSHAGDSDCEISFETSIDDLRGEIYYKRYPSSDKWQFIKLKKKDNTLTAHLPHQPPAGKLAYFMILESNGNQFFVEKDNPVIIRYRGEVPSWVFYPHVFLMFLAMFFANLAGLFVLAKKKMFKLWGNIAFFLILFGGMLFGPLMQKAAFGEYWTGIPNGWDLTDNKTLIAFIFWIIAFILNKKKNRPTWILVASIITLIIFSIPHSMFGSEFDYESGEVVTGFIQNFIRF